MTVMPLVVNGFVGVRSNSVQFVRVAKAGAFRSMAPGDGIQPGQRQMTNPAFVPGASGFDDEFNHSLKSRNWESRKLKSRSQKLKWVFWEIEMDHGRRRHSFLLFLRKSWIRIRPIACVTRLDPDDSSERHE